MNLAVHFGVRRQSEAATALSEFGECSNARAQHRKRSRASLASALHSSAFSLVEVMVAILVLGIALVGMTQGVTTALNSGRESEEQATAALFAAGQMDKLRVDMGLKDEETEGDFGDSLPRYRWKQTVTAAGLDGLHEVVVLIINAKSGQPIYELRTLLFERPTDSTPRESGRTQGSPQTGGRAR